MSYRYVFEWVLSNCRYLMEEELVLEPFNCLENPDEKNIVLIKLNTPIGQDQKIFNILSSKACLKAVVDGAINEIYNCPDLARDQFMPDFISGDFDSAKLHVLEYYRNKGVEIICTPDQNKTDFTKALQIVCDKIKTNNIKVSCICAHVSFDGRFDHVFANINTLYEGLKMIDLPIYLICGKSLCFLVRKGRCVIKVESSWRGKWCGLIPVGEPCQCITTTGLEYNLDHQTMQFGTLISTSNSTVDKIVTVETDSAVLMTIGMKEK